MSRNLVFNGIAALITLLFSLASPALASQKADYVAVAAPAWEAESSHANQTAACQATYRVVRGDSLYRIGQRYGVNWREIAQANNIARPYRIFVGQRLCIPGASTTPGTPAAIPTFTITSVVRDQSVTIRTANFPANMKFEVRMGAFGTQGVNGTLVTTIDSGSGGSFDGTFSIPAALQGSRRVAIRLQASQGYFSYNWFYNSTTR